ncbi:MAG: hypothetical protein KBT04_02410 [Bacteroidales bacterium]|nr:hypothetical protein [Candidatus Colimorpha onthohippi]
MKKLTLTLAIVALIAPVVNAQRDWGCSTETQQQMMETVSLYQSDIKDYKSSKDVRYLYEAYPKWKSIVAQCPKQSKNLYINGVNILKAMINKTKDATERQAYIDELMAMYDTRIANYGEAAEVTAKKAMDLEQILGDNGVEQIYALYDNAVRTGGEELDAAYVVKYMEYTIKYVRAGKAEPTLVVDNYDIASELLDKELEKNLADSVSAAKIRSYISGVENAFSPYAGCEQLVEIYSKKFEAQPDNVDLLKKITNIMMKKGCTSEQLFFDATEKLYSIEPSPATAMRMGQMSYSKKEYSKAISYLQDAVKNLTEKKDLYKANILLGLSQAAQNALSSARNSFYEAAKIDPSKGEPYLQIAQIYAQGARSIDDGMGGRSAYWAAVDKARKAKEIDPSDETVEAANKIIGTFSAYFPKKNDAFMLDLIDGKSYHVGGWIGESTIVRTR